MKRIHTFYTEGWRCTECGQVYTGKPKSCINCGCRDFADLTPKWHGEQPMNPHLDKNGKVVE